MVCSTTVHHPTITRGSIQGNTNCIVIKAFYKLFVNLLNGGGGRYELVTIGSFITAA